MANNDIGIKIEQIRTENNLSQRAFAELLNVYHPTISDIDKGKRDINLKVLLALKEKFNVSADWLLFGEGVNDVSNVELSENDQKTLSEYYYYSRPRYDYIIKILDTSIDDINIDINDTKEELNRYIDITNSIYTIARYYNCLRDPYLRSKFSRIVSSEFFNDFQYEIKENQISFENPKLLNILYLAYLKDRLESTLIHIKADIGYLQGALVPFTLSPITIDLVLKGLINRDNLIRYIGENFGDEMESN